MTDQAQAVESDDDLNARMMAVLDEEEGFPPEESANEGPEDEEQDVDESEDSEAAPEAEDELEVIVHNGEEKQLTKAELKELAQQGFDYTQKTQQLAETRRYLEQQEVFIQQQAQFTAQFTDQIAEAKALQSQLDQWKGVNWSELAQTDPAQYLSLHHQYQETKEAHQNKLNELNYLQQQAQTASAQQQEQLKAREAQAMRQAIPEWKDPALAQAEWAEIDAWLAKAGYEPGTLNNVMDHRQIVIARKAMAYDKLMASGKQKVATTPPPTAKPGATSKPKTDSKKLRDALKSTGSGDIAVRLIEQTL